jgi:WD40 repeat protein
MSSIRDVAVSPDGEHIVVVGMGGQVAVFRVLVGAPPGDWKYVLLDVGRRGVSNVSFFPGGRFFAASGNDLAVQLWDAQTHQQILALKGHSHAVLQVRFSPNGRKLASTDGRAIFIWDLFDGEQCVPLRRSGQGEKYDEIIKKVAYSEVAVTMEREPYIRDDYEPYDHRDDPRITRPSQRPKEDGK